MTTWKIYTKRDFSFSSKDMSKLIVLESALKLLSGAGAGYGASIGAGAGIGVGGVSGGVGVRVGCGDGVSVVDGGATTRSLEVELGLEKVIPAEFMLHAHHWLILHGRYTCLARKPRCEVCLISDLCRWPEKTV